MTSPPLRWPTLILALLLASCGDEAAPEGEVPSWAKVAPEQIAEAKKRGVPVAFENDLGMRFVLIPAGTFLMGSPEAEEGRSDDETQHEVTISRPFYMSIYEVTNGQYRAWRPEHDSGTFEGRSLNEDRQPALSVRWIDAVAYAEWLTRGDSQLTYRLPTEAEWEHACRGRTRTAFSWGNSSAHAGRYANLADQTAKRHRPTWTQASATDDGHFVASEVGTFLPGPWGLHDMHGNAWEWCQDFHGAYAAEHVTDPTGGTASVGWTVRRVLRGGSWSSLGRQVRCAYRTFSDLTDDHPPERGFRLVSPLSEKGE